MKPDLKCLTLIAIVMGSGAFAQEITVPEGCEAFLTVQSNECSVSHYWTCEADPEGVFWRLTGDADGPSYLAQTDADYRWLLGFSLRSDSMSELVEEADPANLDELFETGRDDLDFTLDVTENGMTVQRRYAGFDQLSGPSIEIDGRELLLTEFAYEYEVEAGTIRVAGNQFIDEEWRLFFSGIDTVRLPTGDMIESDGSPREFIEPGEAGFLSALPRYDCGRMGSLSLPERLQRVSQ